MTAVGPFLRNQMRIVAPFATLIVLSLADRIVVMKKGRIVHEFAGETVSKDQLLEAA